MKLAGLWQLDLTRGPVLADYQIIEHSYPFAITGVDFVGPFFIKADHDQQDNEAYIVIFSCGTSRAVHFTTTRTMLASEFIDRLNEFIAAPDQDQSA